MNSEESLNEDRGGGSELNDVLAALREVARSATQGQWHYGATPCPDKAKAMELFEENLDATKSPDGSFYEMFLDDGRRTAVVGNGPTSEANSRFIATFSPNTVLQLLDKIEELMAANAKLTRAGTEFKQNPDAVKRRLE